jgi:hypothetical protein
LSWSAHAGFHTVGVNAFTFSFVDDVSLGVFPGPESYAFTKLKKGKSEEVNKAKRKTTVQKYLALFLAKIVTARNEKTKELPISFHSYLYCFFTN